MKLTNTDVIARLRERGATHAVIEFSGSHDEGGANAIDLYAGEEPIGELPPWVDPRADDPADAALVAALTAPLRERWGGFDDPIDVDGTLRWDVATGQITMSGRQSVMQNFEETL